MSLNTVRSALIVGGTSGIGEGIAVALARKGNFDITIAGRSSSRAEQVLERLRQESPDCDHKFVKVDGFNLKSFDALKEIKPPDMLVMTMGMATMQGYTPTSDGIDQKLQLHYFSRIYLAKMLAPSLKPGGRILSVLSAGVHSRYDQFQEDFLLEDNYSIKNAADAAGFYNDAGFEQLAINNPALIVAHAVPGFVNTNWGTEFPWYLRGVVRLLQNFGRSSDDCGTYLSDGLLKLPTQSPESGGNFYLLDQNGKIIQGGMKHSAEERDIIWSKTLETLPDVAN